MKKLLSVLVLVLAVAGVFASGSRDQVTVEGTLTMNGGYPAIESAGKAWFLPPGPFYQLAWENGIKVGDRVKAEGFSREGPFGERLSGGDKAAGTPSEVLIVPSKVWVNGKALDLSTLERGFHRRGPGSSCQGDLARRGRGDGSCEKGGGGRRSGK